MDQDKLSTAVETVNSCDKESIKATAEDEQPDDDSANTVHHKNNTQNTTIDEKTESSEKSAKERDKSNEATENESNADDSKKLANDAADDLNLPDTQDDNDDDISVNRENQPDNVSEKSSESQPAHDETDDVDKGKDSNTDDKDDESQSVKGQEETTSDKEKEKEHNSDDSSEKTPESDEKAGDTVGAAKDKSSDLAEESGLEKDESLDKSIEPRTAEFVQILQDKQDDSQIENASGEAEDEDPFASETMPVENVETDILDETNEAVDKDQDQEDPIKATETTDNEETSRQSNQQEEEQEAEETSKVTADTSEQTESTENKASEDTSDTPEITPNDETTDKSSKHNDKVQEGDKGERSGKDVEGNKDQEGNKSVEGDKDEEGDKEKKNDGDETPAEEQSTVLPGQDDELCIIPDNMKVVLPQRSKIKIKVRDANQISEQSSRVEGEKTSTKKGGDNLENNVALEKEKEVEKTNDVLNTTPAEIVDSIIDIDDESKNLEIEEIRTTEVCKQCNAATQSKIKVRSGAETFSVCSIACKSAFTAEHNKATDIPSDGANSKYEKRCAACILLIEPNDDRNLSWETMEFCNEECLGKFQTKYGSYCRNCNGNVAPMSLGKYCVRFGYDVRQFCCSTCLEEFKKGLKVCSYCQKDISSGTDGFLAPVGDKGQFKDFCTQFCMEKYSKMNSTEPPIPEKKACSVCQEEKIVHCEVQIDRSLPVAICSEPCFAAFKFVNKVDPDLCSTCKKYFDQISKKANVVFFNNEAHTFCSKTCLNIFIITHRKIVPCNWCKVKKYNFDMIKKELKNGPIIMMCSLNCLTLYQVSMNAVSARRINCNFCKEYSQAQYHLTMSDATIRNFCCYDCVMKFQSQYTKAPITIPSGDDSVPVPTGVPKRTFPGKVQTYSIKKSVELQNLPTLTSIQNKKTLPVISSVTSLASNGQPVSIAQKPTSTVTVAVNNATISNTTATTQQQQIIYKQQVITRPPSPVKVHNKMTQCKPIMHTKGVSVKPHPCTKSTQTDDVPSKMFVPIPVPIYVPCPVHMWSFPYPVPVPVPLPIPVPIFIPTTRNSAKGIFKEIKRIQEKMPSDPFEAELLMMAEMVATDKKPVESEEDSETEEPTAEPETPVDSSNTFGDDMLQMALKMATGEIEEPGVDLETALTPNTITATQTSTQSDATEASADAPTAPTTRGRKRTVSHKSRGAPTKRGRRASTNTPTTNDVAPLALPSESQEPSAQPQVIEPIEKPDANMALKYTFGVNAWRKWVGAKNTDVEKQNAANKKKWFKTDLLQLTADELNYSLCLFVKEVRKPNGSEYAPDTIYYLCLGIQQYLFENNRIDNIFTDSYYEQFTDCLNDVAKKFSVLYNDAQYIVTRVEEEHLWECKQLGAHSPHVLLSTLMFFNTKHFNLTTVDEHMQLSFSHIMKHWKRNYGTLPAGATGKVPVSRNVLLRFYPPQSALDANSKKKKVYEQQENEDNPLRCPVKLYEFYLSKCPESVKTRNDVFYLLPERSCVPDSPVWYSTSPLGKEHLIKMLNRVKMVKEINIALLST